MNLRTYNGVTLPPFLYGTAWKKDATTRLVELAVGAGFRGIDTANQPKHYDEARVGEALRALREKGVRREELFLQTKFTPADGHDHRIPYDRSAGLAEQVRQSLESSLEHLHADTLDSYVLHGPYSRHGLTDADREVWAAIEEVHRSGRARIIGVSNVTAEQLLRFCEDSRVKPMIVQNRCYAITGWDRHVREVCRAHGVVYEGFSLLTANPDVLADPAVRSIARRLEATPEQVVFRFAMQVGMLPLTGTTSEEHMALDLRAESLALSPEEVRRIEAIAA